MQTIFGVFNNYEKASEAIEALRQERVPEAEMNAIVQMDIAKEAMRLRQDKAGAAVSEKLGGKTAGGMNLLAGGQPPIPTDDAGKVLASGELATQIAQTASGQQAGDRRSLEAALKAFGVPEEKAAKYTSGIAGGGILLVAKVDDEKGNKTVAVLQMHQVSELAVVSAA